MAEPDNGGSGGTGGGDPVGGGGGPGAGSGSGGGRTGGGGGSPGGGAGGPGGGAGGPGSGRSAGGVGGPGRGLGPGRDASSDGGGPGGAGDELVAAFARWAADQRVATAAVDRARERSLRDQAAATASWLGVLVDLAERSAHVTVAVAGQRRSGHLVGVGRDFCVLQPERGHAALISTDEIALLWPDVGSGEGLPAGDRSPSVDLPLTSALAMLAEERSPVGLVSGTGFDIAGDLVAVGEDVLTLRTAPPIRRVVYVPIWSVAVCELR